MRKIRGTNVYPRAIEAIVREYDAIDEFQIVFHVVNQRDEITVRTELRPGRDGEWEGLQAKLAVDLSRNHEGLRIHVEKAEEGSLPRFELKAKRVVDKRNES